MSIDEEGRSTISGPMASSGSVGIRSLRGRWQWLPTVAVGEPCRPVLLDLRSAVRLLPEAEMESWAVCPWHRAPRRDNGVESVGKDAEEWWKDK